MLLQVTAVLRHKSSSPSPLPEDSATSTLRCLHYTMGRKSHVKVIVKSSSQASAGGAAFLIFAVSVLLPVVSLSHSHRLRHSLHPALSPTQGSATLVP
jgi:hypothetical protein